jgi:BlaI family penicillinase repressor
MLYRCRQYSAINMAKRPVELTEAEWSVIKAIWATEPCTATVIHETLHQQTQWSYSTVRTIMDRMVVKGLLKAEKAGKVTLFQSTVTQEQAQRGELLYALKHAFNGALTPMVQCLLNSENLSAQDLAELEAMIEAKKKSTKK